MKKIIDWPSVTELASNRSPGPAQIGSGAGHLSQQISSGSRPSRAHRGCYRAGRLPEEDFSQLYDRHHLFVLFDNDLSRKYNEGHETELLFQESISHLCVAPILVFYLGDLSLGQFLRGRADLGDGAYPAWPSGHRRYPSCF